MKVGGNAHKRTEIKLTSGNCARKQDTTPASDVLHTRTVVLWVTLHAAKVATNGKFVKAKVTRQHGTVATSGGLSNLGIDP